MTTFWESNLPFICLMMAFFSFIRIGNGMPKSSANSFSSVGFSLESVILFLLCMSECSIQIFN